MLGVIDPLPYIDLVTTPDKRKILAFINKQKSPFLIQDVLRFCRENNIRLKPMAVQTFLLALGLRGFLKRTRMKFHESRGASHVVYERNHDAIKTPT